MPPLNPRCEHVSDYDPPDGFGFRVHFKWDDAGAEDLYFVRERVVYPVIPNPPFTGPGKQGTDPFSEKVVYEPKPWPVVGSALLLADDHRQPADQLLDPPTEAKSYQVKQWYEWHSGKTRTTVGDWTAFAHYLIDYQLEQAQAGWLFTVSKTGTSTPGIVRHWRWTGLLWVKA
jgi:hypothetical protein